MISLVLDTTAFRQNPSLKGQGFKLIERLVLLGQTILHLPYVVEQEFLTQQQTNCQEDVDNLAKALKVASQRALPCELKQWLSNTSKALEEKAPHFLAADRENFENWLLKVRAVKVGICGEQAQAALHAYFHGHPPLKEAKQRKDIPDSFVFQALVKVASTGEQVMFVSEDSQLRSAASRLPNVQAFENLKAFAQTEAVKNLILLESEEQRVGHLIELASHNTRIDNILQSFIKDKVGEEIAWKELDDWEDATINMYDTPSSVRFLWSEHSYFGEGFISLPFEVILSVQVSYYIDKSTWAAMDEEESPSVTDHNDHVYEAESDVEVQVSGSLSFQITTQREWLDDEMIIDESSFEIESISSIECNANGMEDSH